jgi:CarD family transcriptional regulator
MKKNFSSGDYVVYPAHGVGKIQGVEVQEIAGHKLEVIIITFDKDRMTLRLPIGKAKEAGLRAVSSSKLIAEAIETLKVKTRVRRTMWSRRAQEYDTKINSGDPVSVAQVIRELHRTATQPEQSYSERQVYQAAFNRLAGEIAIIEKIDPEKAAKKIEKILEAA